MHPNFEKILRFAQTTGDRLVVTDQEGREPMVIMSLASYAELVGFSGLKRSVSEDIVTAQQSAEASNDIVHDRSQSAPSRDKSTMKTATVAQKTTVDSQETPFTFPKDTTQPSIGNKQPTLAKDDSTLKGVQEEQYYLEPID